MIPPYEPKRYPLGLGASLVAGALSGLLGIGGGPIKVPVMYIFMSVPLMVATATSNFMIGVTAAASAIVYYRRGDILVEVAAPLAVGVFVGSLLGARLAPRIHTKIVVYLLVGVMLYLAGHLGISSLEDRPMSQLREPAFDRVVALVLRVGAFGCFFIMLAGLMAEVFVPGKSRSASSAPEFCSCWPRRWSASWWPATCSSKKKTTSTDGSRWACC